MAPSVSVRPYDSRMKVAFDVGPVQQDAAGVGLYATAMARALARRLEPSELVFIGQRHDASGLPERAGTRMRPPGPYPTWVLRRSASDAVAAGADAVHYSDGLVPLRRHGRTVLAVHDLSAVRVWRTHRARRWLRIPLVLAAPRLAHLIVVPSRATADEVIRFTKVGAARIEIVPYAQQDGIGDPTDDDVKRTLEAYGLAQRGYVLALGTIEPRKNHVRLLRAFEQLVARGDAYGDLRLVVAGGPGWGSAPIIDALTSSPVADRVERLGYVPRADLSPLLAGAAAVAYVSLYEGFGLPVIEALACGAPVVTSNRSSMPEVAGDAAFLVNPDDVGDIARGLEEAIHAGRSDPLAVHGRARAQAARFSWDAAADRVAELYRTRL